MELDLIAKTGEPSMGGTAEHVGRGSGEFLRCIGTCGRTHPRKKPKTSTTDLFDGERNDRRSTSN
jgi:hypothetical protein